MIGQKYLLNQLNSLESLPHFIIIIGPKNSGRRTLAYEVFSERGISTQLSGAKTDDLRTLIETAQVQGIRTCYLLDIEDFTFTSAQVLLKITEEAPNRVYFVLVAKNRSMIPQTLLSRAFVINMRQYSLVEKEEYAYTLRNMYPTVSEEVWREITKYSISPGMMLELALNYTMGRDIIALSKQIGESIFEVTTANALKITNRVIPKDGDDYPLDLLLMLCLEVFTIYMKEENYNLYARTIKLTQKIIYLNEATGINKRMLLDHWIIEIGRIVDEDATTKTNE